MANEFAKNELAFIMDEFQQQMRLVAQAQQDRARLTAVGTARGKRVRVTVNADGAVIDTRFGSGVEDLSYRELAAAFTEAARAAAIEVARKGTELMAPLRHQQARLPKMSDLIEGMPDLEDQIPRAPEVPLALADVPDQDSDGGMVFTDVEEFEHDRKPRGVNDFGW